MDTIQWNFLASYKGKEYSHGNYFWWLAMNIIIVNSSNVLCLNILIEQSFISHPQGNPTWIFRNLVELAIRFCFVYLVDNRLLHWLDQFRDALFPRRPNADIANIEGLVDSDFNCFNPSLQSTNVYLEEMCRLQVTSSVSPISDQCYAL